MALIKSQLGPLGPGFPLPVEEKSRRYLRLTSALWKESKVEGLTMIAVRASRLGDSSIASHPKTKRSWVLKLGAFNLDRRIIRSCCLRSKFSAATAFTPPGLMRRISKVTKWMQSRSTSFIPAHHRSILIENKTANSTEIMPKYEFAMHRLNSGFSGRLYLIISDQ